MKLLFVAHENALVGAGRSLLTLLAEIAKTKEHELIVLLPFKGKMEAELERLHIKYLIIPYWYSIHNVDNYNNFKEAVKEVLNYIALIRIKVMLKKYVPDCVISNSLAEDVGARAAQMLNIRHIYYIREFLEEDFQICFRKPKRAKTLIENADRVIFISKAISQKYLEKYRIKKYRVIYDGIDPEEYLFSGHTILENETIQAVQIGRLCDGKGTLDTIKVFGKLKSKRYVLDLYGYGEPAYVEKLEKYIEENNLGSRIRLHGFDDTVSEKIKSKDILIMNSKSEGLGRVTLEGMLAGCLVIGRAAGATLELIQNGVNGLTYKNSEGLENILDHVVPDNQKMCQEIARSGQEYVLEQFRPEKNAREFLEWMRE